MPHLLHLRLPRHFAMPWLQLASLDEYDQQIASYDQASLDIEQAKELIDLKRRRNALIPICSVSPEILASILLLLRRPRQHLEDFIETLRQDQPWSYTMLISTRFREVALATPALWSAICFTRREEWNELCLERARGHPLSLLSCPIHRQKLVSHAWVAEVGGGDPAELAAPAPHLKILCFRGSRTRTDLVFGSSCFGGIGPSLSKLTLAWVALFGDMPSLPSLRRLELHEVRIINMEAFINILQGLSNIQELLLEDPHILDPAHPSIITGLIVLPQLRPLYVKDRLEDACLYMPVLPTPSMSLGLALRLRGLEEDPRSPCGYMYQRWGAFASKNATPVDRALVFSDENLFAIPKIMLNTETERSLFCADSLSFFSLCLKSNSMIELGLLADVPSLHLLNGSHRHPQYHNGWIISSLAKTPSIRSLILGGFDEHLYYAIIEDLQDWIEMHPGRIHDIQLLNCHRCMKGFGQAMKNMGIMVSWDFES
jgi:hypothetical protein